MFILIQDVVNELAKDLVALLTDSLLSWSSMTIILAVIPVEHSSLCMVPHCSHLTVSWHVPGRRLLQSGHLLNLSNFWILVKLFTMMVSCGSVVSCVCISTSISSWSSFICVMLVFFWVASFFLLDHTLTCRGSMR